MVKLLSVMILAVTAACGAAHGMFDNASSNTTNTNDMQPLIVGGVEVPEGSKPWVVGLRVSPGSPTMCGGSLISPRHVLSAAHCSETSRPLDYVAIGTHYNSGEWDGERIRVRRRFIHPSYTSPSKYSNDFMILELEEPSSYTPVTLGTASSSELVSTSRRWATTMGWGATREGGPSSDVLLRVDVPVWTNTECTRYADLSQVVDSTMFCAGGQRGRDSCQGDSGGPITMIRNGREVQVGVVSWGDGCARQYSPGVYGRLSAAAQFIRDNAPGAVFSN